MAKYPMTESIARREYTLTVSGRETKIVVQLGRPAQFPDAPAGDWYCPWTLDGPSGVREHYAGGVDGLQALVLAISGLRAELQALGRKGQLRWLGSDSVGLDLVGPAA
jgi:hypothetical protein